MLLSDQSQWGKVNINPGNSSGDLFQKLTSSQGVINHNIKCDSNGHAVSLLIEFFFCPVGLK